MIYFANSDLLTLFPMNCDPLVPHYTIQKYELQIKPQPQPQPQLQPQPQSQSQPQPQLQPQPQPQAQLQPQLQHKQYTYNYTKYYSGSKQHRVENSIAHFTHDIDPVLINLCHSIQTNLRLYFNSIFAGAFPVRRCSIGFHQDDHTDFYDPNIIRDVLLLL